MSEPARTSTVELRAQYRESQRQSARLRLLTDASRTLAGDASPRLALRAVLGQAARYLTADAALLLQLENGGLTVQATHGPALPPGARLPATGALRSALQAPLQVRERTVSRLRVPAGVAIALEILLPLRLRAETLGLLALSSARTITLPDAADLEALQALATLLAAALEPRSAAAPRGPRATRREALASMSLLTPREQQVLALLPRGASNAEIAHQLGIATGTAKIHVERILHKLGLKHRTQAAVRAAEWGVGQ